MRTNKLGERVGKGEGVEQKKKRGGRRGVIERKGLQGEKR